MSGICHDGDAWSPPHDMRGVFSAVNIESEDVWRGWSSDGYPWEIYQGTAAGIVRQLPDSSVDCVITSPPYFWLRDYGIDGQIGQEETVDEYISSVFDVMTELKRILRPEGLLFLNVGDTFYSGKGESRGKDKKSKKRRFGLRAVDKSGGMGLGLQRKSLIGIPWRMALRMIEDGWALRSAVIWHRQRHLPEAAKDRPGRSYEYVFMFAKNRRYYFNKNALSSQDFAEDVWTIPVRSNSANGLDTAPFPDNLVKRCLDVGCPDNGIVLDPFLGSGTTVRVALSTGRPAVGIELSGAFCRSAAESLETST